jgi:thioredoxin reductase (NADPH)
VPDKGARSALCANTTCCASHRLTSPPPPRPRSLNRQEAAAKPSASDAPASDTTETFDLASDRHRGQYALRRLYHESTRPIAVLYTSPTCGPCRSLKPIINSVVTEYAGRIYYVEIDIEADPEIAEAAGVNGTPTLQLFADKERVANLPGVKQKSQYRSIIEAALQQLQVPANVSV